MARCFVIQPFDGGAFDKRFEDVLIPAIGAAGLDPYRVDRDPSVTIPVDAIETGIREAAACVADISTDNPNVWFELGFALACRKPLLLICASSRSTRFPFDVQHRHVIMYRTESSSDFATLGSEITVRLRAALQKEASVQALSRSGLTDTEGLEPHEITALVIVAEGSLGDGPSAYGIKQDMLKAGYTELAAVLAVRTLEGKRLVDTGEITNYNGETYRAFVLSLAGAEWLHGNRARLMLRLERTESPQSSATLSYDDFPETLDQ